MSAKSVQENSVHRGFGAAQRGRGPWAQGRTPSRCSPGSPPPAWPSPTGTATVTRKKRQRTHRKSAGDLDVLAGGADGQVRTTPGRCGTRSEALSVRLYTYSRSASEGTLKSLRRTGLLMRPVCALTVNTRSRKNMKKRERHRFGPSLCTYSKREMRVTREKHRFGPSLCTYSEREMREEREKHRFGPSLCTYSGREMREEREKHRFGPSLSPYSCVSNQKKRKFRVGGACCKEGRAIRNGRKVKVWRPCSSPAQIIQKSGAPGTLDPTP